MQLMRSRLISIFAILILFLGFAPSSIAKKKRIKSQLLSTSTVAPCTKSESRVQFKDPYESKRRHSEPTIKLIDTSTDDEVVSGPTGDSAGNTNEIDLMKLLGDAEPAEGVETSKFGGVDQTGDDPLDELAHYLDYLKRVREENEKLRRELSQRTVSVQKLHMEVEKIAKRKEEEMDEKQHRMAQIVTQIKNHDFRVRQSKGRYMTELKYPKLPRKRLGAS